MSQSSSRLFSRRFARTLALVAWTFLGFMLAQAIGFGVVAALQAVGVPLQEVNEILFNTVANACIYSLAIVIIIGVPWWVKKYKTTLTDLGLNRLPRWSDFGWLLVGAIAYLVLTMLVTGASMLLFPDGNYTQEQETGFANLANRVEFFMTFISLVIVAPVAEEVIFRGYLLGKVRKHAAAWVSVGLTALLFAIAHFQFNVALDTFALGIVLALLRLKTGSIWASILLHMLKNGLAFYFLFVNPLVL